jgi:neutral ceramidase
MTSTQDPGEDVARVFAGTDDLRAGIARAIITPPLGSPLVGFADRGDATGCHDELTATALVLESGQLRVALVACDLLYIRGAAGMKHAISEATGIPAERVLLTASHTHYGPALDSEQEAAAALVPAGKRSLVTAYRQNLIFSLAGVVAAACQRLTDATIGWTEGSSLIGINRRERLPNGSIILGNNPDGPCDRRVLVTRIDRADGRPLAVLLNTACHGVSLGSECTEISADFPGVARELIERETGAACMFLQGAAGNVNPTLMGWDWTYTRRLGLSLGAEGARLFWTAKPERSRGLGFAGLTEPLPALMPDTLAEAKELVAQLQAELESLEQGGSEHAGSAEGQSLGRTWAQWRLTRAMRAADALAGSGALPPVPAELAAVRLGEGLAMVTSPGEVFNELGQELVAQSPFPGTIFCGYTNEAIGYVPTPAAYSEGGYEVTHSCFVASEAAALLERRSMQLLDSVTQR